MRNERIRNHTVLRSFVRNERIRNHTVPEELREERTKRHEGPPNNTNTLKHLPKENLND